MTASDSPLQPRQARKLRRDGWTAERQLRFLDALAEMHSVAAAAAAAGMTRQGAYRLRNRSQGSLFALLWDRALTPPIPSMQGYTREPTMGQLCRLLGVHYRRKRGDFIAIGRKRDDPR